jgi:hypothetical protein
MNVWTEAVQNVKRQLVGKILSDNIQEYQHYFDERFTIIADEVYAQNAILIIGYSPDPYKYLADITNTQNRETLEHELHSAAHNALSDALDALLKIGNDEEMYKFQRQLKRWVALLGGTGIAP